MGGRWRRAGGNALGIAAACILLLAGCGRTAGRATVDAETPARAGTGSPVVAAPPATPATPGPPPIIANASGTPPRWWVSPVVAPTLAVTPTPLVCPTPDPRLATVVA